MTHPCLCAAYSFPHRRGSGKCSGAPFVCSSCGKECNPEVIDFGIGPYECWGARGTDVQEATVSNCCEAAVYAFNSDDLLNFNEIAQERGLNL